MQHDWKSAGSYGTVGLELALSILFGFLGGRWLDQKLGTSGWLSVVGLAFGGVAGGRAVWRALERANREAEQAEEEERAKRKDFHDGPKDSP